MKSMRGLLGAAIFGLGMMLGSAAPAQAPASAPASTAAAAPDYRQDATWLCLPGRADACGMPLATTALNANGYGSVGQVLPARNASADCFYVYPTASLDKGLNSDLTAGLEENGAATVQFARFSSVCRTFAPIYRQMTRAAIPRALAGENLDAARELAYSDVKSAWRQFLASRNAGRPFVLIGHSQGTIHLVRLIAEEIEGRPEAKRMLSAILLGWPVEVPEGKLVGGSFKWTPLCRREGQTGCVVAYMSFRASIPPTDTTFLGHSFASGTTAACTNPAALRGGSASLDSYWFALSPPQPGAEPITWSSQGKPPTPFVRTEGLAVGSCVHKGKVGYLAIAERADPKDARTDRIPGDIYIAGKFNPGWGLHLADVNVAQGDLIRLVEAQSMAYRRRGGRR